VTPPRCAAIITAAGTSARMGGAKSASDGMVKKEYRCIDGVPVLARALLPFVSLARFSPLIVTVPPGDIPRARELLSPHVCLSSVSFIEGGPTRQDSVYRALRAIAPACPELVLIHDGARPWVGPALIQRVLAATELYGGCVPLMDASEAVKEVGEMPYILRHLERQSIRYAQTPQGFSFARILAAHEKACGGQCLCADDGEIFDRFAGPVAWVPGEQENRKITWEHDMGGQ
jgi:2-C-methyl-D-erythritol 4-phosphate cytidylyltransferase